MPNFPRRAGAAFALLALVLCLPQGSLMLCASEGGRVVLEAVCDPSSPDEHAGAPAHVADEGCDCHGGCGPCQDSQVGTELTPGRAREESPAAAHALVAPFLTTAFAVASMPGVSAASRRPAPAVPPHPLSRVQAGTCLRI
jgi:hypothetical protein